MKRLFAAASLLSLLASCAPRDEHRRIACGTEEDWERTFPTDIEEAKNNPSHGWLISTKTGTVYLFSDDKQEYIAQPKEKQENDLLFKYESKLNGSKVSIRMKTFETTGKPLLGTTIWTLEPEKMQGTQWNFLGSGITEKTTCIELPINHPINNDG